jgi:hypothetical protein
MRDFMAGGILLLKSKYLVDDTPTSIIEAYSSPDADDWKDSS